jgi:hypothetical protein
MTAREWSFVSSTSALWTIAKYLRIKMKPDEFPVSAEIPEKVLFIEHPGPKPAGGLPP